MKIDKSKFISYICCYKIVKIMVTGLIIGFFIGSITTAIYINWFIKQMKKQGYIKTEATQKLKDELK